MGFVIGGDREQNFNVSKKYTVMVLFKYGKRELGVGKG